MTPGLPANRCSFARKDQLLVSRQKTDKHGFTLLELLVVVAILAIIAGAVIVAYDGLESKSAEGVAAHTIGALDSTIRQYRATNANQYPNDFDSLLFSSGGAGTDGTPLNVLPAKLRGKIGPRTLTVEDVASLQAAEITNARYVLSSATGSGAVVVAFDGTGEQAAEQVGRSEILELKQAILRFKQDTGWLPKQGPFDLRLPGRSAIAAVPLANLPGYLPSGQEDAWFDSPANLWQIE